MRRSCRAAFGFPLIPIQAINLSRLGNPEIMQRTQFRRSRLLFSFYFIFMLSNLLTSHSFTGDLCTNEDVKKEGICVSINNCEMYNSILRNSTRPLPQDIIDLLKKVHCGFQGRDPLVCCVNKTINTNVPATPSTIESNLKIITEHENLNLLNRSICGRSNTNKIFNGNKTGIFEFPWMALIAYRIDSSFDFRCGGTVINSKYVLTAAHCIQGLQGMTVAGVRLGEHDTTRDPDCEVDEDGERLCAPSPRDFKISKLIAHPDYNKDNLQDDIGLIRILGNSDYNDYVRPICLPIGPELQNNNLEGERPTIAGWGSTEKGDMSSPDLLKIHLPMVPLDECIRIYRRSIAVTKKQLCAGGSAEGSDSCHGDSGGPLMHIGYVNNYARFVQFGIVSFGPRYCATNGQPGVYTRVGHYIKWILDSIEP